MLVIHVLWAALSIGLTHVFRGLIQRYRRPEHSTWRLWPLLLGGILVISALQTALVVDLTSTILPVSNGNGWSITSVIALGWGMYLGTGIWTVLYIQLGPHIRG